MPIQRIDRRYFSYSTAVPANSTRVERNDQEGAFQRCNGLFLSLCLVILISSGKGQSIRDAGTDVGIEDAATNHFVAVHGQRSVIMGYPSQGLEVWGYPFQMLSGYRAGFKPVGATTETDGAALLRHVEYRPEAVIRTYIGPNYLVRETIFVPLDRPAAILSYEVEGATPVDIAVHFQPVMDLMWPGSVGGQYTRWNPELPGYTITEPEHGNSASIGSSDILSHDETVNSTVRQQTSLSFVVHPHVAKNHVAVASVSILLNETRPNEAKTDQPATAFHDLSAHTEELRHAASVSYASLSASALEIDTPDVQVNRAIAWSETALQQAWVCTPRIGCGIVAGYGPSRDARRPQYAWFFAGDGLVATNALIAAGEYARAKEELTFISQYQQPKTGMIWHELSQSAGYIDWAKYPYMYVHVDITADYLATLARYVQTSGDLAFLHEHWPSILDAYRYCHSLIDRNDHLPHIPPDKEGGDEQARPRDDLSLSSGVLAAMSGFAELAKLQGDSTTEAEAQAMAAALRQAIAAHYWDAAGNFWIDGHTQSGAPIASRRLGPVRLIPQDVFSPSQNDALFRQLASAEFRTDWGMREVSSASPEYDPYSYGRGSVSAPATAQAATAFWLGHRPEIGLAIWRDLLPWNDLDAPGHMHEVLTGNFFHEQTESVPEQTWSSAAFLDSTVLGLLGLRVHGLENRIDFSPRLPAEWDHVSIQNIRLPHGTLDVVLTQSKTAVRLEIDNHGAPTQIVFEPRLPLGAHLLSSTYQGRHIATHTESLAEEERASLSLQIPAGRSLCELHFEGGISLVSTGVATIFSPDQSSRLQVGAPSKHIKITAFSLSNRTLSIEADVHSPNNSTLVLQTSWKLVRSIGATSRVLPNGNYQINIPPTAGSAVGSYTHACATLTFVDH